LYESTVEQLIAVSASACASNPHRITRLVAPASVTVGPLFAHLADVELATIASHAWLHAFGVPPGMAARPMMQIGEGPSVGLIVLDREPNAIVAEALVSATLDVDCACILKSALDNCLTRPFRTG
jgi:hypothetical protein